MRARLREGFILVGLVFLSFADSKAQQQGKDIKIDGINDFWFAQEGDTLWYWADVDTPVFVDGVLLSRGASNNWNYDPDGDGIPDSVGLGDAAPDEDIQNWGNDRFRSPPEMSKMFVTNDSRYLYIGLEHTDVDGNGNSWGTQVGISIDVNRSPEGGNLREDGVNIDDPWGNKIRFAYTDSLGQPGERPDYLLYFAHWSNDIKFYEWDLETFSWVQLPNEYDPYSIQFHDGGLGDQSGETSGDFVEVAIPLVAFKRSPLSEETIQPGDVGDVFSIQAWSTQNPKGAFDTVPSDYQELTDTTTNWDPTEPTVLTRHVAFTTLISPDLVDPDITYDPITTSIKGERTINVIATILDRTAPGSVPSLESVQNPLVIYSAVVDSNLQLAELNTAAMINIQGTDLWTAVIPDTVYYFLRVEDIPSGGLPPNVTYDPPTAEPSDSDSVVLAPEVYSPPDSEAVSWTWEVGSEGGRFFIPDGTRLELPRNVLAPGTGLRISVPDPTTFSVEESFRTPDGVSLRPVGRFRRLEPVGAVLSTSASLTVHYLQPVVDSLGIDEGRLRIYRWVEDTGLWVRVGGQIDTKARAVSTEIRDFSLFGLFEDSQVDDRRGVLISDLHVDPNPFSPNGDGLYDRTSIQFTLSTEAKLTVKVYDIRGDLVRMLAQDVRRQPGANNLIWDGRDDDGEIIPFGIYFVFFLAVDPQNDLPLFKTTKGLAVVR